MHVLVGENWARDLLDPTPPDGHRRVQVIAQVALSPVDDQYFVRGARLSMLISYVRSLGPRRVLRKVVSRRAESRRNDAWLSVGVGRLDGRTDRR